jgi:putative intracellular protease/amidase
MQELATTRPIAAVSADGYDAIFLVGGTGTAWDFPKNAHVRRLVETLNARDAVVAGVCHGVLGLTAAMTPEGIFLLKARRVTGISNKEDELVGVATVVPVLPEEQLRRAGGLYLAAAPFAENVVSDGNVYTGQNPASARPLAEAILARLEHPKSAVAAG